MKIDVFDINGKKIKDLILDKEVFEAKINEPLMAQAVRVYLSNQRKAAGVSLTRAEVNHTRKKVYRQKGTGGARHGDKKSPIYVGGGKAHGPKLEQNYDLEMPKKMKIAALKSALSFIAKENKIVAVSGLSQIEKPKTKTVNELLIKLFKPEDLRKIGLVLTKDMNLATKSAKNVSILSSYQANDITTYDVLHSRKLILAVEAVEQITSRLSKNK